MIDHDPIEQVAPEPEARHARKPWHTPQLIVAKADGGTENASYLPDDGPFSVS